MRKFVRRNKRALATAAVLDRHDWIATLERGGLGTGQVYDELRKLAAQKLAQEKPGQMLEATALVHEAYLRLVDVGQAQHWNSRGYSFAAAAEAPVGSPPSAPEDVYYQRVATPNKGG